MSKNQPETLIYKLQMAFIWKSRHDLHDNYHFFIDSVDFLQPIYDAKSFVFNDHYHCKALAWRKKEEKNILSERERKRERERERENFETLLKWYAHLMLWLCITLWSKNRPRILNSKPCFFFQYSHSKQFLGCLFFQCNLHFLNIAQQNSIKDFLSTSTTVATHRCYHVIEIIGILIESSHKSMDSSFTFMRWKKISKSQSSLKNGISFNFRRGFVQKKSILRLKQWVEGKPEDLFGCYNSGLTKNGTSCASIEQVVKKAYKLKHCMSWHWIAIAYYGMAWHGNQAIYFRLNFLLLLKLLSLILI